MPQIDTRASRLVGGCAQQSLDPLEPTLDVEQLDLPNVVAFDHRADSNVDGADALVNSGTVPDLAVNGKGSRA
jgi:hypothetical protein